MQIKLSSGKVIPIEMHKVRIVQKTQLPPVDERLRAITEAGYNTFLLRTRDVFIDMLTDSGTNAMSDNQLAAMMVSDDAYAGGESYYKLADAVREILGFEYYLPTHQGRAAEHLLAKVLIKQGQVVPMNYHFTTTKAHFEMGGGKVLEIYGEEALNTSSTNLFQGQSRPEEVRGGDSEIRCRAHRICPHGGHDQSHRWPAVFDGEPEGGQADGRQARHHARPRRQPHLRECLLHQAAREGLRRHLCRRDCPRDDGEL